MKEKPEGFSFIGRDLFYAGIRREVRRIERTNDPVEVHRWWWYRLCCLEKLFFHA
jgi:hypothetical protein|tara:strand:- start:752 stop:916 length:165 start_codon:yes stop_codon:yes gene_type:complete